MKKDFTGRERFLIVGPFLLFAFAGLFWQLSKSNSGSPKTTVATTDPTAPPNTRPTPDIRGEVVEVSTASVILPVTGARTLEFSPDGKRLAIFTEESPASAGMPPMGAGAAPPSAPTASGVVYDLDSASKLCDLQAPPSLSSGNNPHPAYYLPTWSPDGNLIATMPTDGSMAAGPKKLALWDANSGSLKGEYPAPFAPMSFGAVKTSPLTFSPDSKTLSTELNGFNVLNIETGKFEFNRDYMRNQQARMQERLQASRSNSGEGRAGLTTDMTRDLKTYETNRFWVVDVKAKKVAWEPKINRFGTFRWNGDILAVTDNYKIVKGKRQGESRLMLWDGKTRKLLPAPPILASSNLGDFVFNPNESTIAYFCQKLTRTQNDPDKWGELVVWNYVENRVVWRVEAKANFKDPQWSPDGKRLTVFGSEYMNSNSESPYSLYAFDETGTLRFERKTSTPFFRWSPDGQQLAVIVMESNPSGYREPKTVEIQRF